MIPEQYKNEQNEIGSRFNLLSLTRGYVRQQLDNDPSLKRDILQRLDKVQSTIEEAERARKQYRFSLANLGATTEEEKVAAMIAQSAFQKYQGGRYLDAVEDYRRAIGIAPRFSSLYRNWAVMEAEEQHYVESNELLKKATELSPKDAQIWLIWGNIKRKEGKIKESLEKYEIAYQLSPEDHIILNALGQAKSRSGDYAIAHELFTKALEYPGTGSAVQNEIVNRSSIAKNLNRWAESEVNSRNYTSAKEKLQEALEHCRSAIQLDSLDMRSQEVLRRILRNLGFLYKREEPEKAIEYFKQAIVDKPVRLMKHREASDTLEASLQAGEILVRLNRLTEARQVFPKNMRAAFPGPQKQSYRLRQAVNQLWENLYATESNLNQRFVGTVIQFSENRGYGFIQPDNGTEIFFHITSIQNVSDVTTQLTGVRVEYETGIPRGRERPEAVNVIVIKSR